MQCLFHYGIQVKRKKTKGKAYIRQNRLFNVFDVLTAERLIPWRVNHLFWHLPKLHNDHVQVVFDITAQYKRVISWSINNIDECNFIYRVSYKDCF